MKKFDGLDIIVPVSIGGVDDDAQHIADSILAQYTAYGFTRFALFMPGKGWRSISYPPREYFEQKAELFLEIRKTAPCRDQLRMVAHSRPEIGPRPRLHKDRPDGRDRSALFHLST